MGSVVGEKLARAADSAAERSVPLVAVTASGGARMQEGILSLMQLPKTVCAIEDLRDARCAFVSVMTHPTTAGVLASFASLGDVIVAEPGALLVLHRPARRTADDPREAPRRLRARRVRTSASATSTRSCPGPSCGPSSAALCGSSPMAAEDERQLRERLSKAPRTFRSSAGRG